jgi:hypothetical protein
MIKEIPLASPNFLVYCVIYVQLKMCLWDTSWCKAFGLLSVIKCVFDIMVAFCCCGLEKYILKKL